MGCVAHSPPLLGVAEGPPKEDTKVQEGEGWHGQVVHKQDPAVRGPQQLTLILQVLYQW